MKPSEEYEMSLDLPLTIHEKLNLEHNVSSDSSIKYQTWLHFQNCAQTDTLE
jgi:hypothetical protein